MSKEGLWRDNPECPNCGRSVNPDIQACETGYSYCSNECALEHIKKWEQEKIEFELKRRNERYCWNFGDE